MRWKAMTEMQYSMGSELGELGLVDEDMEDGRGKGLVIRLWQKNLVDDDAGDGGQMELGLDREQSSAKKAQGKHGGGGWPRLAHNEE